MFLNIDCPFTLFEPRRIYPHKQQRMNTLKSKGFLQLLLIVVLNKFKVRTRIVIAYFVKFTGTTKVEKKISLGLKKGLIATFIGN